MLDVVSNKDKKSKLDRITTVNSEIQMDFNLSSLSKEFYKNCQENVSQESSMNSMEFTNDPANVNQPFVTPIIDTQYNQKRSDSHDMALKSPSLTDLAEETNGNRSQNSFYSAPPVELQQIAKPEYFENNATVYIDGDRYHYMNGSWRSDPIQLATESQMTSFTDLIQQEHIIEQSRITPMDIPSSPAPTATVGFGQDYSQQNNFAANNNSSFDGFSFSNLTNLDNPSSFSPQPQIVHPIIDYAKEAGFNVSAQPAVSEFALNSVAYVPRADNNTNAPEFSFTQIDDIRQMKPADVQNSFVTQGQITDANIYRSVLSESDNKNISIPDNLAHLSQSIPQTGMVVRQGDQSYLRTETGWSALSDAQMQTALSAPSSVVAKDAVGLENVSPAREKNILEDLRNISQTAQLGSYAVYGNESYHLGMDGSWKQVDRDEALNAFEQQNSLVKFASPEVTLQKPSQLSMSELMDMLKSEEFVPQGQIVDNNIYQLTAQSVKPIDNRLQENFLDVASSFETGTVVSQGSHLYMKLESGWGELSQQQMQAALSAPSSVIAPNANLDSIQTTRAQNVLTELQFVDAQPGSRAVYGGDAYQFQNDGTWKRVDGQDAQKIFEQGNPVNVVASTSSIEKNQQQLSNLINSLNSNPNEQFAVQGKLTDKSIYQVAIQSAKPVPTQQQDTLNKVASTSLGVGTIVSHDAKSFIQSEDGWKELPKQQAQIALATPSSIVVDNVAELEDVQSIREKNISQQLQQAAITAKPGSYAVYGGDAYQLQDAGVWKKVDYKDALTASKQGSPVIMDSVVPTVTSFASLQSLQVSDLMQLDKDNKNDSFVAQGKITDSRIYRTTVRSASALDDRQQEALSKLVSQELDVGTIVSQKSSIGLQSFIQTEDGWRELPKQQVQMVLSAPSSMISPNAIGLENIRAVREESVLESLQSSFASAEIGSYAVYGNETYRMKADKAWTKVDTSDVMSSLNKGTAFVLVPAPTGSSLANKSLKEEINTNTSFDLTTMAYMLSDDGKEDIKSVDASALSAADLSSGFVMQGKVDADVLKTFTSQTPILSASQDSPALDKLSTKVDVGTVVKHGGASFIRTDLGWESLSEAQVETILTHPSSVLTNQAVGLEDVRSLREKSILEKLNHTKATPGTCAICGNDAFVLNEDRTWVKIDRAEAVSELTQIQNTSEMAFRDFGSPQKSKNDLETFQSNGTYASGYINALVYIPSFKDENASVSLCPTPQLIKPRFLEQCFVEQGAIMDAKLLHSVSETTSDRNPIRDETMAMLSVLPNQDMGTLVKHGGDTFVKGEDGWKLLTESELKTVLTAPSTILARDAIGIEAIQSSRMKNIISELEKSNAVCGTLAIYGNDAFQLQLDKKDGQKKWVVVSREQAIQFASQNKSGVNVLFSEPESPLKLSPLNGFQKAKLNTELDAVFGPSVDGDVVSHRDRFFIKSEGNWIEVSEAKAKGILASKEFKNPSDLSPNKTPDPKSDEQDKARLSRLLKQEDGFSAPLNGDARDENDRLHIRYSTGRREKVAEATKMFIGLGVNAINNTLMSSQTIAGEGYRVFVQTVEILRDTVGVASVELVKACLRKPLQRELQGLLKQYGVENANELLKVINTRLRNAGQQPLPMVRGVKLQIISARQLRRTIIAGKLKGISVKEVADIYKLAHRVGVLTTFEAKKTRISSRLTKTMRSFVSMSQKYGDIAGAGIAATYRIITTTYRSVKTTIRTTHLTAKVARILAKKAANATAKVTLFALRKTGGDVVLKKVADRVGKTGVGEKFSSVRSKIKDRKKSKKGKKKEKFRKKREKFSSKVRSKVQKKLNSIQTRIWNKLTNRFGFLRQFQRIASVISKISAMIAALISVIINLILLMIGILAGVLIITLIVWMVWSHFAALFNFSNQADKARAAAISSLSEAYEDDMNRIMELKSQGYESVNITYENVKDQESYDANCGKKISTGDGKTDDTSYTIGSVYTHESFQQTSNAAEILSMSCVKFDYNIGDGSDDDDGKKISKRKLKKYVKGMYHGSHEIVVTENVTQDVDENGNVVEHKTADVTYRSYFYDDLFEKTEADETPMTFIQSGISDGTAEGVTTEGGIYAYLRDAGFSHNGACGIMGNAQQESSFNPRCETGQYYGLFQWDSEAKNRLIQYCSTNNLDYTTIAGQVSFVAYDVGQGESSTGRAFKYTKIASILKDVNNSPEACASVFCVGYERCVGGSDPYKYKSLYWPYSASKTYSYQQLNKRIAYANAFASKYAQYQNDWSALKETISSGDTNSLVDYAKSWVGKIPYKYGGPGRGHTLEECASKQLGTDCSGFVASVFKHFGVSVPTSSSGYGDSKKAVAANAIQPGDIVVWPGSHVAIYIGNDQIVHAANPKSGIIISSLSAENKYHSQTPKYYRYYTPSSSGTSGSGSYDLQTRAEYKNIQYGHNSIYNSGCGPTSLANVIRNYVKAGSKNPTTVEMCNYAVKVGARESGGTNMYTLLSNAGKTYGFSYQYTTNYTTLFNHLKAGKMAVIHTSGVEPFSSGGHFLAAIGVSGDKVVILDPYWTQSKKERYSKHGCTLTSVAGKVIVPKNVFTHGIDGYYLITKK